MKKIYIITSLAFFITSPCLLFAQVFYNNGATVWTGPTSIIGINGGLENKSSGLFNGDIEHNGDMIIRSNPATSFGNVTLSNNSVMRGNGTYHVEQDWVNNATFTANSSTVELYGNLQQFITGTNVTTFHNLTATGTGTGNNRKKTQTINAYINPTGILDLNDRELETQTNTMFVMNPSTASVDNDSLIAGSEGFVSSIAPGYLHRETNVALSYVFPVGSSAGGTRYRPIRIHPTLATPTYYNVRFINYNSDNDGFLRTSNDGIMYQTIDTFYHAIDPNPAQIIPADISIYYKNAADGGMWNGTAHWRTNNAMWNNIANIGQSTSNGFDVNTKTNWLFANPGFPYLLSIMRPSILIPNVFTPDGDGINDVWYIPNSGMKEFHVEIFDRWGVKVWESTTDESRWDGHSPAGNLLSDGTYYYVLKAFLQSVEGDDKDFSQNGYITLITQRR